jgi:hypothetical protein
VVNLKFGQLHVNGNVPGHRAEVDGGEGKKSSLCHSSVASVHTRTTKLQSFNSQPSLVLLVRWKNLNFSKMFCCEYQINSRLKKIKDLQCSVFVKYPSDEAALKLPLAIE